MATVYEDLRESPPQAGIDAQGNRWALHTHYVKGLGGVAKTRALRACANGGIPQVGTKYDAEDPLTQFMVVQSVDGEMTREHADVIEVKVRYGIPSGADIMVPNLDPVQAIEVGSTVQMVETMFDVNGELIVVFYEDEQAQATVSQPGRVLYPQAMTTLRFVRKELGEWFPTPGDKAKWYAGTTNRYPIWGETVNRWLCTGIPSHSDDNGYSMMVDYNFQLAPEGKDWDGIAIFQRPDGTIPGDIKLPKTTFPPTGGAPTFVPGNGVWKGMMAGRKVFQQLKL